jgi:hypothetical protein
MDHKLEGTPSFKTSDVVKNEEKGMIMKILKKE